jgi:hypothetical protein
MTYYTSKRIKPTIYSNLDLTRLKQLTDVEHLLYIKLEQLVNENSNIRYFLTNLLKSDTQISSNEIKNILKKWNIEIEYDINYVTIQNILNFIL